MREFILLPITLLFSIIGMIVAVPLLLGAAAIFAIAERRGLARIGGLHADASHR
jgi:hypothetical protein